MEVNADQMVGIALTDFVASGIIPVDIYIRLPNGKFILIAKEGTKSVEQLKTYENRAVSTIYIHQKDYHFYAVQNISLTDLILSKPAIPVSKKAQFLSKSSLAVMKEIDQMGFTKETFDHARVVAEQTTLLVDSKPELLDLLESFALLSDDLLGHSIAVSTISVMLGKALGWTTKSTFEKVALGGLLHDIGLKQVPPAIIKKPQAQLSFDEMTIFEGHAYKGMEILRSIPSVPEDVISIAYEHHENSIGQGYPRKIRDVRMNPLAKIVACADQFVELCMKSATTQPRVGSAEEAIIYMERVMGQPFNREVIAALKLLVRFRSKIVA